MQSHYTALFGDDPALHQLREDYAMPSNVIPDAERREAFTAFIFWATWATVTERPGQDITYTHNWPPDDLVGNHATPVMVVTSVISFVLLLGGIGGLAWFFAASRDVWRSQVRTPAADPLISIEPTPSMNATHRYFWVVGALAVGQIIAGIVIAHYGVEGTGFYGFPLSDIVPYSLARTWHVQMGMLWIATSWLATGLCLAPLVAGHEPRLQRLGVNVLLVALVVVVGGSMFGQALAIHQVLSENTNFWIGHQGYEYLDLGRLWQTLLFVGLLLWLVLMIRPLMHAWKQAEGNTRRRQFLGIFMLSVAAIALFYAPGLIPGQHTNLAIAEYWRWWVVHLWVEGFFEVFATTVIALIFVRLGLVRVRSATMAILFSTTLYLSGGVLGMLHHLYFTGTTPIILVVGGTMSALELMPLVMVGFEAYDNLSMTRRTSWIQHYKWPVYFFVAASFWNLVGAGLFGFLINPPIALYYMQGLNTTSVHAHAALFGVYGNLGLGLTLLSLRVLTVRKEWRSGSIRFAFWSVNVGLMLMVLMSLLPVGWRRRGPAYSTACGTPAPPTSCRCPCWRSSAGCEPLATPSSQRASWSSAGSSSASRPAGPSRAPARTAWRRRGRCRRWGGPSCDGADLQAEDARQVEDALHDVVRRLEFRRELLAAADPRRLHARGPGALDVRHGVVADKQDLLRRRSRPSADIASW